MKNYQQGFTLIELVLVVAILAIIATIAIGKFGDLSKSAARKAELASLNNIQRTIDTELANNTDSRDQLFDYVESLCDVDPGAKAWVGTAGTYDWTANTYTKIPGLYCGIKESRVTANASGVTTGTAADLAEARKKNTGLNSNFLDMAGVYFLTAKEVTALKTAGLEHYLQHNYTTAQAYGPASRYPLVTTTTGYAPENNLAILNGGPGFRADMSAFYPCVITNGSPVCLLNPAKAADIYRSLGVSYPNDKSTVDAFSQPEDYFKGGYPRLLVFGLGRSTPFTAKYFESPPFSNVLNKTEYRNYLLVFSMLSGQGSTGYTVSFVGVLTPSGQAAKGATYNLNWGT